MTSIPLLPPPAAGPVVDVGCRHGDLVRFLQAEGFEAENIDISPEQAALARAAGVAQVGLGDFRAVLPAHPAHFAAITATDLLDTEMLRGRIVTLNLAFAARKGVDPAGS